MHVNLHAGDAVENEANGNATKKNAPTKFHHREYHAIGE
jgi:hypothetical protein